MVNVGEILKFPIDEVKPIIVEAPRGNKISTEFRENRELAIYGASSYWGLRIPTLEILSKLNGLLQPLSPFVPQGFEAIYTYPEGLSEADAELWEVQAAVNTLRTLSERSGIGLDEIGLFAFACGTPIGDQYAERIAHEAGIPPECPRFEVSTACNSGARAHAKIYEMVEQHPELAKENVLLMAHEGMRRLIPSAYDTTKGDPFSLSNFGNATAAMIFRPENMRRIVSITEELEDGKGALAGTETYTIDKNPDTPLVQIFDDGMTERIRLPTPPPGMRVSLKPIHTTFAFGMLGGKGGRNVIDLHDKTVSDPTSGFEPNPLVLIIAHQPSDGMLEKIRRVAGIDSGLMPFLGKYGIYGNSSGATSLLAFTKFIQEFKPGMHIAHLGLGAGFQLSATALQIVQVIN